MDSTYRLARTGASHGRSRAGGAADPMRSMTPCSLSTGTLSLTTNCSTSLQTIRSIIPVMTTLFLDSDGEAGRLVPLQALRVTILLARRSRGESDASHR